MKLTSIYNFFYELQVKTGKSIPNDRFDEVLEYISMGIKELQTPFTKVKKSCVLYVENYEHEFPKGFESTISITKDGQRLRLSNSDIVTKDLKKVHQSIKPNDHYDYSNVQHTQVSDYNIPSFDNNKQTESKDSEFEKPHSTLDANYYVESLGGFNFSFDKGEVLLTYYSYPVDDKGLLKIPDSQNYKNALYWNVVSNLLLTGWKHPANINHQYAQQQYEQVYAPRAINELKRFTPEDAEYLFNSVQNRLVLPVHFYRDYWINSEQIQQIGVDDVSNYYSQPSDRT